MRPVEHSSHHTLSVPDWPVVLRPVEVPYDALRDGPHTVVVSGTTRFVTAPLTGQTPVAEVPFRLEAEWNLTAAEMLGVELVDDESLREQIEPRISAGILVVETRGGRSLLRVTFLFNRLPVGISHDVSILAGGDDSSPRSVVAPPGAYAERTVSMGVGGLAGERVDVVLRPNPDAAAETLDVRRVWNREMIIRDVPVMRLPPRFQQDPPRGGDTSRGGARRPGMK